MLHARDTDAADTSLAAGDRAEPPAARLARLLAPERIMLGVPLADAQALFAHVAAQVAQRDRVAAPMVLQRLQRRHARRSTALGGGVALPHAEITHLPSALMYFVRPAQPLDFGASDGRPVSEVLVLLVRKPATSAEHHLLVDLTHWLCQPALRRQLAACSSVDAVWRLLAGQRSV